MLTRLLAIKNPSGLHMRPAGMLAKAALPFVSKVTFSARGEGEYDAKSMLSILSAAVKCGDEIALSVSGDDEVACMDAVVAAIESGLGEKME